MSKYLGFDQSYNSSGFCVTDKNTGEILTFGTFKSNKTLDIYDRAIEISHFIVDKINTYGIIVVNLEGLAFGIRGDATRDLAGLLFVLIAAIRQSCITVKCNIIAPTSLKKFATGSGKAKKPAMFDALPDHMKNDIRKAGYKKTTGAADVCDAYWLAKFI